MANQPQQQQQQLFPLFMTKDPGAAAKELAKVHGYEVKPAYQGRPWSVNSHGDLAIERAICEMFVYDKIGHGPSYLLDIGGRAQRWQINNVGSTVWTVQPKLCSSDNPHDIDRFGCAHTWAQCGCIDDPNGIVSVHAIYHLSEAEVTKAACLAADNSTHFYSIEHNFLDEEDRLVRKGKLGSAEFECMGVRTHFGTSAGWAVSFNSDEKYNHPLPGFVLSTGDVIFNAQCCGKHKGLSVSRTFVHRVGSTCIFQYKFSKASPLPLAIGTSRDFTHDNFDTYSRDINMVGTVLTVPIPAGASSRLGWRWHGQLCECVDNFMSYIPHGPSWTARNWVIWLMGGRREFVNETISVPQRLFDAVSARRVVTQEPDVLRGMVANFLAAQPVSDYHTQEVLGEAVLRVADNKQVVVRELMGRTTSVSTATRVLALISILTIVGVSLYYASSVASLMYYSWWLVSRTNSMVTGRSLLTIPGEFSVVEETFMFGYVGVALICFGALLGLTRHRWMPCIHRWWTAVKLTTPYRFGLTWARSKLAMFSSFRPSPILFKKFDFDNGSLPQLIAGKRPNSDIEPALNPSKDSYYQATGPVLARPVVVMSGSATNINYAIAGRIIVPVRGPTGYDQYPIPGSWVGGNQRFGTAWDVICTVMTDPNCPWFWGRKAIATVDPEPPVDCLEWINTRPTRKQRARYLDAKARLDLHGGPKGIRGFHSRTVFAKIEKTFDETKLPRAIVGATDEYQVCCGPEVTRISRMFHSWTNCCTSEVNIRWTEGWTSQQLTQEFNEAYYRATSTKYTRGVVYLCCRSDCKSVVHDCDLFLASITIFVLGDDNLTVFRDPFDDQVKLIVNDLSKFDCTHNSQSWRAAKRMYKILGMKDSVLKLLEKANDLHGKTIKGGYFRSKWNMPSGNPDTCLRNSLINAMFTASWFYMRMESMATDLPIVGPSRWSLENWIKDTGFEPKLRVETVVERVDFLSGIFLSRDDGSGFEWVPKVFRLIHRLCYSVDSRVNPIEYNRAVAECYRAWEQVPVLREWVAMTLKRNECKDSKLIESIKQEQTLYKLTPMSIKPVRASFMMRYGLNMAGLQELQDLMLVVAGYPIRHKHDLFEACLAIDL